MAPARYLMLVAIACAPLLISSSLAVAGVEPNDYPAVIAHEPPMIGMFPSPVPPDVAQRQGLPLGTGVFVVGTIDGSMAAGMGLKQGDVVLTFNGTPVNSYDDIVAARDRFSAGDHADMEFVRDGVRHVTGGTLGSWPRQDSDEAASASRPSAADADDTAQGRDDGGDATTAGLARLAEVMLARLSSADDARDAEPATPWRLSWRMQRGDEASTASAAEPSPAPAAAATGDAWRLTWSNAR